MATKSRPEKGRPTWEKVRGARDYREFLRSYLEERGLTLSDLARASGFGRGFPGDVISGKRRLTTKSSYSFEKALKIPAPGRKLFRFLVALEEPDVFPELERDWVSRQIEELRRKPWETSRRDLHEKEIPAVRGAFRDPAAIRVYAAAGRPGQGATMAELQRRTRLDDVTLATAVRGLEQAGLLRFEANEGRYEPQDLHLFFRAKDRSAELVALFKEAAQAAGQRIETAVDSPSEMFFCSTFCVDESRLPELKAALRETILKFVDDSIHAEGDRVVQLITALHL